MPHYAEILLYVFSSNKSILLHNLCRALKIGRLTLLHHYHLIFSVVLQSPSLVPLFPNPWTAAHQAPLSFTISQSFLLDSCPLSQWCYLTISSSPTPFPFYIQSFPASRSFPESALHIRWPMIGASAAASVLPMNIQGWFALGLTGLISLLSKRFSRIFSSTTIWKRQFFGTQPSLQSNSHIHTWLLEKP